MARPLVLVFGEDRSARMHARRDLLAHDYPVRLASTMAEAAKAIAAGGVGLIVLTRSGEPDESEVRQIRDTFALPVVRVEPGSARSIVELVRTVSDAHEAPRDQDGASE